MQRVTRRAAGGHRTEGPARPTATSGRAGAGPAEMLRLQRLAGNRAASSTVKASRPPVPVQRHSSWEHAMLGDVDPKKLGQAVDHDKIASGNRIHVLLEEKTRAEFFQDDATVDPTKRFPDIRWLQLKASNLWLSYGEMNALSDYLPDAATADNMSAKELIPVLQRMRQGIADQCREVMGLSGTSFKGAAWSTLSALTDAGGEVKALDGATAQLGQNRYAGLLARNACHFAPMSWQRWSEFHAQARQEAQAHHDTGQQSSGNAVGNQAEAHERQAWLQNGYGDHFLQDSFAAGHLVNKTLIMQWFAQYVTEHQFDTGDAGMPDQDVLKDMSDPKYNGGRGQAGIAGRSLYGGPNLGTADRDDRNSGMTPTDSQSAQERNSQAGRVAGSGVTAANGKDQAQSYGEYGEFLNSAYMQKASGAVHDYFNARGVWVRNAQGKKFLVGGDDTLLTKSDADGAEAAGTAAHQSQAAISALLAGQKADGDLSPEKIFELVPKKVVWDPQGSNKEYPLESWNDDVLHDLCVKEIFPNMATAGASYAVRMTNSKMVSKGVTH